VLLPLALGPDSQSASQSTSRQAAIQVLAVIRRLFEVPGDPLPARLSLGLVLPLLPPEVLVLLAFVVHDPASPSAVFEIVGAGPLHPSVLLSLVSASRLVVWADPLTQHMGCMAMTSGLCSWLVTALGAVQTGEVAPIVYDTIPASNRSIRFGYIPWSPLPPLAADPLPSLSPSRPREPSIPELVDSDAFPVSSSREPYGGFYLFFPAKFRDAALCPAVLTPADFPRPLSSSSPYTSVDSLWADDQGSASPPLGPGLSGLTGSASLCAQFTSSTVIDRPGVSSPDPSAGVPPAGDRGSASPPLGPELSGMTGNASRAQCTSSTVIAGRPGVSSPDPPLSARFPPSGGLDPRLAWPFRPSSTPILQRHRRGLRPSRPKIFLRRPCRPSHLAQAIHEVGVVRFLTGLVLMFAMLHEALLVLDAGFSGSISGDGPFLGSPGSSPFLPTPVGVESEDAGASFGAALEGLFSALPLPPEVFLRQSPSPLFEESPPSFSGDLPVNEWSHGLLGFSLVQNPPPADLSLFDHGDYHRLVCGWNINGYPMDSIWVQELYARLSQRCLDALFLIDTRTPSDPHLLGVTNRCLIANLGDEYMVYVSPGCSSGVPGRNEWVGGVTLVVRKRVFTEWTVSKIHPDPSGCAMYLAADLHHSDGRRARLMGVYLPLVSLDPPPARPSVSSSVETQANQEPSPLASSALLPSASSAAPKTPPVSALATKVRLFLSPLPPSPDRPALAEAWFWHRYEVLPRDPNWELILVGDFNRS
jgi:hypothetical protein